VLEHLGKAMNDLSKLRTPFPENQISYLPKGGVKLAYVGHAALTDRLLDVDPNWTWEPLAYGPDGLPAIDEIGGLWIKLTVCGVTRLGYGDAQGKTGGNAMKERIGDALRNAGMRFGAALDLWHKGELHAAQDDDRNAAVQTQFAQNLTDKQISEISALLDGRDFDAFMAWVSKGAKREVKALREVPADAYTAIIKRLTKKEPA
jgi:hypothetical protein